MQVRAVIVMPITTPQIKVDAVRGFDAEVILHGDNFDQALAYAQQYGANQQLIFLHPTMILR